MSSEEDRLQELLERTRAGGMAATSQLITSLETGNTGSGRIFSELHRAGGGSHVVGVTGAPGSGKSTLVGALAKEIVARGRRVAIIAVDPSSALTGGAILGDRIRMQEHALNRDVFVRSMSTRGSLGGVSRATADAVSVLDAAGWDYVIVETVGVGQAEVEIMQIAHTVAVVSVPGLGDDVQAIKAGLMEIADVHVVNKADRPGADKTAAELLSMLTLAGPPAAGGWPLPVLRASALRGEGVDEMLDALDAHLDWLASSGERGARNRKIAAARIRSIVQQTIAEELVDPATNAALDEIVEAVAARRVDPHAAARALIEDKPKVENELERTR